jgi:hypothetical protein
MEQKMINLIGNSEIRLSTVTASLLLVVAIQSFSQPIEGLKWSKGDKWKYETTDLWTKLVVSSFEREVIDTLADGFRTKVSGTNMQETEEIVKADGTQQRKSVDGVRFDYRMPPFPLFVGNKWETTNHAFSKGSPMKTDLKCNIAASEEVAVPAGKFDTFRIECKGYWYKPAGYSGRVEQTLWFSEKTGWMVKYRYKDWYNTSVYGNDESVLVEYVKN